MARKIVPIEAPLKFRERMFFTLGLKKKPLRFFCDKCGKFIPSDMAWVCGACDHVNLKTRIYSFLFKCKACKEPPLSLKCPHCKDIVYLSRQKDRRHPAQMFVPKPVAPPQYVESREEKIDRLSRERMEEEERLKHEIHVTKLTRERDAMKKAAENEKKSVVDKLKERREERRARTMAVHEIAKEEKERDEARYANDPDGLEKADSDRKAWVEDESHSEQGS